MRSQHHHLSLGLVGASTQALDIDIIDIIIIIIIIITHSNCDIRLRPGVRDQNMQTITTLFNDLLTITKFTQMECKLFQRVETQRVPGPGRSSFKFNSTKILLLFILVYSILVFISWISDLRT
jgi:hypothetical protein